MQESRIYKTPCPPPCGGIVELWSFSDCDYDDTSGINCKKCKRSFTPGEWDKIASKEFKSELREREAKRRNTEKIKKRALAKLTKKEKESLGLHLLV